MAAPTEGVLGVSGFAGRVCGWCLCSNAARPACACDMHWGVLMKMILTMTLLGVCSVCQVHFDVRAGLLCWCATHSRQNKPSNTQELCWFVFCDVPRGCIGG